MARKSDHALAVLETALADTQTALDALKVTLAEEQSTNGDTAEREPDGAG